MLGLQSGRALLHPLAAGGLECVSGAVTGGLGARLGRSDLHVLEKLPRLGDLLLGGREAFLLELVHPFRARRGDRHPRLGEDRMDFGRARALGKPPGAERGSGDGKERDRGHGATSAGKGHLKDHRLVPPLP